MEEDGSRIPILIIQCRKRGFPEDAEETGFADELEGGVAVVAVGSEGGSSKLMSVKEKRSSGSAESGSSDIVLINLDEEGKVNKSDVRLVCGWQVQCLRAGKVDDD